MSVARIIITLGKSLFDNIRFVSRYLQEMRYNPFANPDESPSLEPLKSKLTTTDLERTAKCYKDFNFKLVPPNFQK